MSGKLGFKINKDILWGTIIFLLPFDSSPLAPGGVVRPLSVYFAFIYFILYFKPDWRTSWSTLKIGVLVIILLLYSLFRGLISFGEIDGFLKFSYNVFLVFVYYFVTKDFFSYFLERNSIHNFWVKFTEKLVLASIIPCVLGLSQFLFIYFGNRKIIDSITRLFVYKTTERIQLTFGEQSFSVIFLAFLTVLVYVYYEKRVRRKYFLSIYIFLFLASSSTFGLSVILLTPIIYLFCFRRSKIIYVICFLGGLIVISWIIFPYLPDYTRTRIEIIIFLFNNFDKFLSIASKDDSIFLRLVNPYIGFLSFKSNLFLGCGGENFSFLYPDLLMSHYPFVADNPQIKPLVDGVSRTSPKNMYVKIFAEFGIVIGFWIFTKLYSVIKNIKGKLAFELLLALILGFWLQLDAYFYPIFVIVITLIVKSVEYEKRY